MPAPGRDRDEEIVAEMLEVLAPAAGRRAALARKLRRCVEEMRKAAAFWSPTPASKREDRETTRQWQRYRTRLLAVKRYRPERGKLDDEFLAALDGEIKRVNEYIGPGRKPRDMVAELAVGDAWELLPPAQRTLTVGKAWHTLSMLLYEAGTGKSNSDHVLKYMTEMKSRIGDLLRR
jgi:hypothetical protein